MAKTFAADATAQPESANILSFRTMPGSKLLRPLSIVNPCPFFIRAVFRGVDWALADNRECEIAGTDLYGAQERCRVRVCEVGPFLVLKLIASGFGAARAALAEHFTDADRSGPLRGAAFVFGENPAAAVTDEHLRFRQELVNFGRALLEAT